MYICTVLESAAIKNKPIMVNNYTILGLVQELEKYKHFLTSKKIFCHLAVLISDDFPFIYSRR